MLKSYFRVVFRSLLRQKLHTIINISGLAIGISACMVIFVLVNYEQNFDTFHPDKERIYRVYTKYSGLFDAVNSGIAFPVPAAIRKECSGVAAVGHFITLDNLSVSVDSLEGQRKKLEKQNGVIAAEPDYFKVFKAYQWLAGTPEVALNDPFKVVLSESSVKKYFGNASMADVIGREIVYDDSLRVTVTGIVQDLDRQSDFYFTDFISFSTIAQSWLKDNLGDTKDWSSTSSGSQVFIKLEKDVSPERISQQFAALIAVNMKGEDPKMKIEYKLQPLSELRFSTIAIFDQSPAPASHSTLNNLLLLAGLLLLIAGINFVNLATTQAIQRSKEVGVRKTMGSSRAALVLQFLSETLVLTSIATLFSVILTKIAIYEFHEFLPEKLQFSVLAPSNLLFMGGVILSVGLLAGLYPAFVLSAFRPAIALKPAFFSKNSSAEWLRKGLIVFQFTISLALIIGALIIDRQIHFMRYSDMGFNKDAVIHFEVPYQQPKGKKTVLKNKLEQIAGIQAISMHASIPASNNINTSIFKYNDGKEDKDYEFHVKVADSAYIHLYDIPLLAGHNIQASDTLREFVINETAMHLLGFKDPQDAIDKTLINNDQRFPIVGVVKDFHIRSLQQPIYPLAIVAGDNTGEFSLKLATNDKGPEHFKTTMETVGKAWQDVYPNDKFEYEFVDKTIADFYESEQRTSRLIRTATGIAIFLSCIGLFGLVSFTVVRRTKEIGVRKVLGASVAGITGLLAKDFLKLVVIAIVVASPIAWYFMQKWLADFVYRIDMHWWIFALAGIIAVAIAFITVSFQSIRAALANPVRSLRSE